MLKFVMLLKEIMKSAMGFLIVGLVSFCSIAEAYIPPSQYILKTLLSKHTGVKTLRIRSMITAVENGRLTDIHFKDSTWINTDTMTVQCIATDDQERRLYKKDGGPDSISLGGLFLLSSDFQRVSQRLKNSGIPIRTEEELLAMRTELERRKSERETLTHWNGGLAWLIGEGLWVEKDTFRPLRLVVDSGTSGRSYDYRFEGSRSVRDFQYPKVNQLYQKDNWVLSSQVIDMTVESDFPNARLSHASTLNPKETGLTDLGSSASSSLRNLLHLYYESYR
jgi:hypothetical protein